MLGKSRIDGARRRSDDGGRRTQCERAAVAERAARGGAAIAPPPDRERLFAAARRRSGRVRLLRRAILVSVVGAVAAMVAIAVFDPFGPKFGSLSFSGVALDGTKVAMAKPRLAGFRSDGQPYVLTAERALQDLKHPTVAELQNLVGDMGTAGGETTRLTADAGVYDSVAERMKLSGQREDRQRPFPGAVAQRRHRF